MKSQRNPTVDETVVAKAVAEIENNSVTPDGSMAPKTIAAAIKRESTTASSDNSAKAWIANWKSSQKQEQFTDGGQVSAKEWIASWKSKQATRPVFQESTTTTDSAYLKSEAAANNKKEAQDWIANWRATQNLDDNSTPLQVAAAASPGIDVVEDDEEIVR